MARAELDAPGLNGLMVPQKKILLGISENNLESPGCFRKSLECFGISEQN